MWRFEPPSQRVGPSRASRYTLVRNTACGHGFVTRRPTAETVLCVAVRTAATVFRSYVSWVVATARSTHHTRAPIPCSFGVLFRPMGQFARFSRREGPKSTVRVRCRFAVPFDCEIDVRGGRQPVVEYPVTTVLSSPSIVMGSGGLNSSHGCVPFVVSTSSCESAALHDASIAAFGGRRAAVSSAETEPVSGPRERSERPDGW